MELSTAEIWVDRVGRWRASGEDAETFSRREGYAASTLPSKLKREMAAPVRPEVQLARVVRTASPAEARPIVLEVLDAGIRISVEAGVDARTLAMVLDVVRGGRR